MDERMPGWMDGWGFKRGFTRRSVGGIDEREVPDLDVGARAHVDVVQRHASPPQELRYGQREAVATAADRGDRLVGDVVL